MKKTILTLLLVAQFGLDLFGEEAKASSIADFGFDFVGVLTDISDTTRTLDFELSLTNRTALPIWGRKIPVAIASNGVFSVRLADASGQPLVSQVTNLVSAVERIGNESMLLTVRDGSKSFAVNLPPSELSGIAELALGASGDFNAPQGLVLADLATSDISAERVVADRISSQTAVKASGMLTVNGNVRVKGTLQSSGPVTATAMTVARSVSVASALETSSGLTATSAQGLETLSVSKTFTVGGINVVVPEGTIIAWNDAANIPAGWAICNGENGTPNMRNRFVVGASASYVPGDAQKGYGGSEYVQLTKEQMPIHSHRLPYYQGKNKSPFRDLREVRGVSKKYNMTGTRWIDYSCGPSSGSGLLGDAHENRPPYYALVFIMKKYGGVQ